MAPGAAGAPPSPGLTTIPTRTLRLPVPGTPTAPQTPQMQQMQQMQQAQQAQQAQTPALSPEEQLILMHAIRESDPNNMPPMPGGELFPQMPPTLR